MRLPGMLDRSASSTITPTNANAKNALPTAAPSTDSPTMPWEVGHPSDRDYGSLEGSGIADTRVLQKKSHTHLLDIGSKTGVIL
ncbi:hypothetical protein H6F86_20910 [Phormidium sp. FACHB-592]|uniref:Uncharacterized protein n=1 Tax=Stenomitos frigidus AS-A4 TaxID=2933935 RepID=A0ABV0KEQ6_9CYAN|nr:hypothetical protein [Phormidium sp. FACHB-592]MBD2076295.1 hypothetical protein [Phormidium sp. FACHB-592]